MDTNVEKIRDLVENMYTNKYLTDFAYKWNQSLTDEAYDTYTEIRQEDFFDQYREKYLDLKEFLDSNAEFTAEADAEDLVAEDLEEE